MSAKYPVGTNVRLKSGGPDMTVKSVPTATSAYYCQWFAGKKLEQGAFAEATLELTPTDTQK